MAGEIEFIHHIGLFAEDWDAAFAAYERLGFVLSPLSLHRGAERPGEPVRLMGSANRCAILDGNYLEITARINTEEAEAEVYRRRSRFLDRYEGIHIICLGSEDVHAVERRLKDSGLPTTGVVPLERDVETPDGPRMARFERVRMAPPPDGAPCEHLQIANHLTPEVVFQPAYMTHPNGAQLLSEVVFCVEDPAEYERKYTGVTGRPASREGAKRAISLGRSRISICGPDDLAQVVPGATAPALPCIAGFTVGVQDLETTTELLAVREIPHEVSSGTIVVPASHGAGASVMFERQIDP